MRPRSLSVACDKVDRFSKKFEGVTSDHEDDSESGEESFVADKSEFSLADYEKLISQIRAVLPKNDSTKADSKLKKIEWDRVAFDNHSPDTVRDVALKLYKGVRKYRTLEEVLDDFLSVAKKNINARKPKMPGSAFNFYVKQNWAAYRLEHPEAKTKSLLPKLSEEFKALPAKKKKKYELMATEAKAAYTSELEKFYQENPDAAALSKKSKSKTNNATTAKGVTPLKLFRNEKAMEGQKLSNIDCKKLWEKLEFDQKIKYIREAYSASQPKLTKDEKDMLATSLGKPEFVARTPCEFYIRKYFDRKSVDPSKNWYKVANAEFKLLPKLRKLEIELEMRRARKTYIMKYQEYINNLPLAERQEEIDTLHAYIKSTLDKEEKEKYKGKNFPDLTGLVNNMIDLTDLPIAESTTNDVEQSGKKKQKKKGIPEPEKNHTVSTPLKSILKGPALSPIVASKKRKKDEAANGTPTKKKRTERVFVEPESDSEPMNTKKEKKKPKKEQESDDGVDSSQGTLKNVTREDRIPIKEPKRPPKDIVKYYKKFHYFGAQGKHKESFEKLSNMRKKSIEAEMRVAQKKYMDDLKKYLDRLPPSEVQSYVAKLKQLVTDVRSADESDEEGEEVQKNVSLGNTKQELTSSSDDDDELSDD